MDYRPALALATTACLEAGALIRAEFHRPGGPRGLTSSHGSHGAKAGIDDEAEKLIRDILSTLAGFAFLGEETTDHDAVVDDADAPSHVWVVDPNDGTSHFLAGERGSAVSIGLLRDGIPVLGAVYSPSYPHDGGDLITWAENLPLTRNGRPVPALLASSEYNNPWSSNSPLAETALVPRSVDSKLQPVNPFLAMPYISLPSIAYRLAKLACGDASVAVSLHGLSPWDVAAGHALVRGAGGTLVDDRGNEVTYTRQGRFRDPGLNKAGAFLAGSKGAVGTLLERRKEFAELKAHMAAKGKKERDEVYRLFPAVRGSLKCVDSTKLSRIQGALVGLLSQADAESGKAIRFARYVGSNASALSFADVDFFDPHYFLTDN